MIKVDLVTGFLGAGKTTFLMEYAKHFVAEGKKVAIIVNDYGAINVDRLLLHRELGDCCQLEMVIGGDKDCSRRRLKTKLITMALEGYHQVLVEPSGLFEVEEFFDLLYEDPLERWYERGNVLTVVEAAVDRNLSDFAKYILATQVANAGTVVVSKCKHPNDVPALVEFMEQCLAQFQCNQKITSVYRWEQGKMTEEEFRKLKSSGYRNATLTKYSGMKDFDSVFFFHVETSVDTLEETLQKLMNDSNAGNIFRIKGFLKTGEEWLEVNATKTEISLQKSAVGQEVFIVIGEQLDKEYIGTYWTSYQNE
ncbi:MAG: GTP-binding protein [Eubacterium sp.]|nr:GTP-binding protein [Eubacterium sp.]